MFTALLIEEEGCSSSLEIREALADAGCLDIETAPLGARPEADSTRKPDLIVIDLAGNDLRPLHAVTAAFRDAPILAVCEERHVDVAQLAGASQCVTRPVRVRELTGRIRIALRARDEARRRSYRERKLSDTIVTLQREKQDLERLVCVDSLTGVANRRHALGLLEAEWRRSTREHHPLGLVMIDLDCYHAYNEQYGHLGGDACLQRVADAMVRCLRRPSDFLGRYGGEEFVAVLPNTDAVGAKIVAERLRAAVEALAIPHAASVCAHVVTITAGYASLRATGDMTVDKLIAVADAALLRAKAQGRNRTEGDAPLVRPIRMSAQRWQRFAPVFADPWFADRIPNFLSEAELAARSILHALRTDDAQATAIASDLRDSARDLSLDEAERRVAALETALIAGDMHAARDATEELVQYITHVQVIYRRPPTEPIAEAIARA